MWRGGPLGRGVWAWIATALLLLVTAPGWATGREQADLYLWLDTRGDAAVLLQLGFEPSPALPLEARLAQALGAPLHAARRDPDEDGVALSAECRGAFQRRGWALEGGVDPAPLLRLLRPLGVQWLTINLHHPRFGFSDCPGGQPGAADGRSDSAHYIPLSTGAEASPVRLTFGYRTPDLWRLFAPLLALLLLPLGLTLWMRRGALRARPEDATFVWFGYCRFLRAVQALAIPVWAAAAFGLHLDRFVDLALGHGSHASGVASSFSLAILPPLMVIVLCSVLSQPVYARVRGMEWTQKELAWLSVWKLASVLLPMVLLFVGMDQLLRDEVQIRSAVAWFGLALAVRVLMALRGVRVHGMALAALTVGELRDRIFALAEKAGVKMQQVYLLPAGKGRMANAFAMQGNNVLLTDLLVQQLSKREVDAIVAHELAHLKRGDPRRLRLALAVAIAVPLGVSLGLMLVGVIDSAQLPMGMAGAVLFGIPVYYYCSRRMERGADAGAVALTDDPESLITGLAKLMQLNLMPMQWSQWDERLLTHPSTLKRVQAIAKAGGISSERLQQILSAVGEEAPHYALPSVAEEERIFSTTVKARLLTRNSWTIIGVMALTPAVVAALLRMGLAGIGGWWGLLAAGLAATLAAYLVAVNRVPLWGYRELRQQLRARLQREGIGEDPDGGCFVGFAPSETPRLYESFYDWDIGFLVLEGERLCYVGEQTRFALRREQVVEVRLAPGAVGWWSAPRVAIRWKDEARSLGGAFTVRPAGAASMRHLRTEVRAFAKQLQAWLGQPASSEAPSGPIVSLDVPRIGEVTSIPVARLADMRLFLRTLFLVALLSAGGSVLLGLSFDPPVEDAWAVLIIACLAVLFHWVPFFRYRKAVGGKGASAACDRNLEGK